MVSSLTFNVFSTVKTGEIIGIASATQLPDIECKMVMFVAPNGNTGDVYLGFDSNVTVVAGATNTTTGFELKASAQTPWIPISNLNLLYRICDSTADDLIYLALDY